MQPESVKVNEYCEARPSRIHNMGLFARKDIPEGAKVIEYVGEKITKKESNRRGLELEEKAKKSGGGAVYIFELNKRHDIDGSVDYNYARFANHSCDPNCETDCIRGRIWITALREIKKGEEITYDYGYDLCHFLDHPCRCGAGNCPGYIVRQDQWPKLARILRKKKKNIPKAEK